MANDALANLRYHKVRGDELVVMFEVNEPIDSGKWRRHFIAALGEKQEWLAARGYIINVDSMMAVETFSVVYYAYVNFTPEQLTEYHLRWLT